MVSCRLQEERGRNDNGNTTEGDQPPSIPEQHCGHGCRTRLGGSRSATPAGSQSQPPASLVEVMGELAPQGLTLKPGPGFAMERNGEMLAWELDIP